MVWVYHQNADFRLWSAITECLRKCEKVMTYADLWTVTVRKAAAGDDEDRTDLDMISDAYNMAASDVNRKLEDANVSIRQRNDLRRAKDPLVELEDEWPLIPYAPPTTYGENFIRESPPYLFGNWVQRMAAVMFLKRNAGAEQREPESMKDQLNSMIQRIWEGKKLNQYRTAKPDIAEEVF